MDFKNLGDLLRTTGHGSREPTACTNHHEIAAYVDGTLDLAGRERLERHLADCSRCTRLVGIVSSVKAGGLETVPDHLAFRARRLAKPASAQWKRYLPPLAAAAAIVLGVTVIFEFGSQSVVQDEQTARTTRGTPSKPEIQVIAPSSGAVLGTDEVVFRWTEVPDARYYVVRVVTAAGELVAEQRVTTNEWRPGRSTALDPGQDYFVRVDAFPAVGPSSSSTHVPFSVRASR